MIQQEALREREQHTPTSLRIEYQGLTIVLTCNADDDEDWHADE